MTYKLMEKIKIIRLLAFSLRLFVINNYCWQIGALLLVTRVVRVLQSQAVSLMNHSYIGRSKMMVTGNNSIQKNWPSIPHLNSYPFLQF